MIRAAQIKDVPAVADLLARAMPAPLSEASIESTMRCPNAVVWLYEQGEKLLGVLILQQCADEAEILSLAVEKRARHRGIGRKLVEFAIGALRRGTTVYLEVRAQNTGAIAFYHALHFMETGIRRGYYTSPPDDALLMKFGKF